MTRRADSLLLIVVLVCASLAAQNSPSNSVVPKLIPFSGTVSDASGKPPNTVVGLTFAFYKDEQGGAPLWLETQNVQLDTTGHYTASLGATKPAGLPLDLFASGEARWLGVQPEGQPEQPRVLVLAVPYALKAADAETVGGFPPSAFVLAAPSTAMPASASIATQASDTVPVPPPNPAVTGAGTVNFIPLWDTTSDIVNSVLFQSGTGATARIGINTTTPAATLDVKGAGTFRGPLNLPPTAAATVASGKNSQPMNFVASSFDSGTARAVNQNFQWQAEPVANNTITRAGR